MSNISFEEINTISGISSTQGLNRTRWINRVSWASVFAGVAVALAVQVLLGMLGTGIGMSTIDPLHAGGTPSASALSIGAGLWWSVSSFIALVLGGWIAAQASGYLRHFDGLLHGLLVWALATLITIYVLGSAISSVASGAGSVLTASAHGIAEPKSSALLWDDIKEEAKALLSLQQANTPSGSTRAIHAGSRSAMLDLEFNLALEQFLTTDKLDVKKTNHTKLINLLMARTGMSVDEATNRVNSWEQVYQQAKQKAREAADNAAKAASWLALWGFFMIVLSAIAGAVGGIVGTSIPDMDVETIVKR
jgi:hypothetical protein